MKRHLKDTVSAFLADEIGLAYLRLGDFVVKTSFEPVFANRNGNAVPAGLRASKSLFLDGRPVPAKVAANLVDLNDPVFETTCNLVHIRNFDHHREEGSNMLFLRLPRSDEELLEAFLEAMEGEIDPAALVCELTHRDSDDLAWRAESLRARDIQLGLGGFGGPEIGTDLIEMLCPEVLRFDPRWLHGVAAANGARGLLSPLVHSIRAGGMAVMADTLESEAALGFARRIGVDLLAGPALAPAFAAGTAPDHRPGGDFPVSDETGKVVPLRPGGWATHQLH